MEEWKQYRLIDVLDTLIDYRGKTPKKTSSGVPLITAKIIKNGRIETPTEFISVDDYDSWMVRGFPKVGDVVLTTEAPLGEVAQLDNANIALAQRVVTLRGKSDVLDNTYLKYYFLSNVGQQRLKARETGTTVTGIKQSELREVIVDVPPYEVQVGITKVLKSLDDKIECNRRINENLEQQAQALFKSWFVDFEPFKDQPFVESELGMIPQGWKVELLGNLIEIKYGKDHKKLSDGHYPVYGSGGLMRYVDRALYEGESVLVPRKGTLNNVMYVNESFWTVDTMFYSIPKVQNIILFTYIFLRNKDLASLNAGSAVPSMTTEILNNMQIVLPPPAKLKEFNTLAFSLYNQIKHYNVESRRLAELRDTLLPRLMSGEIKVEDVTF